MYEDEENKPNVAVIATLGVLFVAAIVAIFFVVARKPEPIAAPAAFAAYKARDNTFACQAPDGWKREESGVNGGMMASAVFRKGKAHIDVTSDLAGSLMGDIVSSGDRQLTGMLPDGMSMPAPRPAVEKLHVAAKAGMNSRYASYDEAEMRPFTIPLGEARFSEWTGEKGGFPAKVKMRGYRATILNNERRVTVLCECPEADWATLKPAFDRVLGSLASGGA